MPNPRTLANRVPAALIVAAVFALALTTIVFAAQGDITTVAGSDTVNDGGPATEARLRAPSAVAVDSEGNLYIADTGNGRVRRVDAVSGVITTIAGGGGSEPDGVLGTDAELASPWDVEVTAGGDVLVSTASFVLLIDGVTGVITKLVGGGSSEDDGIPALQASISLPGIEVVSNGDLYLTDDFRIRKVDSAVAAATPTPTPAPVPGLTNWGLVAMALAVAGLTYGLLRRESRADKAG